jgi:hypothetical protein
MIRKNMSDPKLLKDFLEAQKSLMKAKHKVIPADPIVLRPEEKKKEPDPEDDYEYIITKKPAKKKVEKYLQGLIDTIMEENDL